MIAGSTSQQACLDQNGDPTTSQCFAMVTASLEALCSAGEATCRQAAAALIRYQIQFMPAFLKSEPELSIVERTVSLVLDKPR